MFSLRLKKIPVKFLILYWLQLLMRMVDDFLLITPDRADAERFLKDTQAGMCVCYSTGSGLNKC